MAGEAKSQDGVTLLDSSLSRIDEPHAELNNNEDVTSREGRLDCVA